MYRNQQVLVTAIHIHLSLLFPGRAKSLTLELSQEARVSTLVGVPVWILRLALPNIVALTTLFQYSNIKVRSWPPKNWNLL